MAWNSDAGLRPAGHGRRVLLFGLITAACQSFAAAPEQKSEALAGAFESLAEQVPTHLYDVDALAATLDYDVAAAIRHVTDEIAYEPYVGVLRGPEGTISTSAGSAWDQAVLGAALINAMAGEALVVEGTLAGADVDRLLLQAFEPRPSFTPPIAPARLLAAFEDLLPAQTLARIEQGLAAADPAVPDLDARAGEIAQTLTRALAEAGRPLEADAEPLQALKRRIGEHYVWIRYRDTPNDPWRDAHPAFGSAPAPTVTPQRYLADEVPEAVQHRVEIQLEIERKAGASTERLPLMTAYQRPAANLAAVQVPIAIVPSGPWPAGGEPEYYMPLLHGALPAGAQVFTSDGLTADAGDALAGPGVFAQLARTLGRGLGEMSDGRAAQRLTGVILTVTHIAPGGARIEEQRRLVDLRQGAREDLAQRILMDGVIDVGIGRENGAREQRSYFVEQAAAIRALTGLSAAAMAPEGLSLEDFARGELTIPSRRWPEMLLHGGALEPPPDAAPATFRSGPLVTMRRISQRLGDQPLPVELIDILHHPSLALRRSGAAATYDPGAVMRQGALETVAEGLMIGRAEPEPWLSRGIERVIAGPDALSAWLAGNTTAPGVRDRMAADLDQAGTLVIPADSAAERWWRVNPASGATLGMGEAGGVSLTEEIITEYVLTIYAAISLANNIESCSDKYQDRPKMRDCCIAGQVLLAGAGLATGGAAANAFPKAGAAAGAYLIGMLGYEAAQIPIGWGTSALSESVCKSATR